MTVGDALGLSDARERLLVRAMQLLLVALLGYGLVTLRFGVALNGLIALAVTLLPALIRREYGYSMDAGLVLWITVAAVLHSIGILGLYSRVSWYDEVTHAVSATLIAGVGYVVFHAFENHSEEIDVPSEFRAVFVVVFVVAFGVLWEVLEFAVVGFSQFAGVKPPIVVYGIDDIVTDTIFNTVGAVVVALWGTSYFDDVAAFVRRRLRAGSESEGTTK